MQQNILLQDSIEREKQQTDFRYTQEDRRLLDMMFREINSALGTDLRYLAEAAFYNIRGTGGIMSRYLPQFQTESVRAYLIPQIVSDRISNSAEIVLQSYYRFRESSEYIPLPGQPSPAHISARYDQAFKKLHPRKLEKALLELAHSPRDAFYLPFTMRMLASWRSLEMEEILHAYMNSENILWDCPYAPESTNPSLPFMIRELKFTAIEGLRYYPSQENCEMLYSCMHESMDKDIRQAVKRALRCMPSL